jgi:hypothetical protein
MAATSHERAMRIDDFSGLERENLTLMPDGRLELEKKLELSGLGEIDACAQNSLQYMNSIDTDREGNFVVTWQDARNTLVSQIFAQRFDRNGTKVGAEILVTQNYGAVGSFVKYDSHGDFLVVWDDQSNGLERDVMAQLFNSNGTRAGGNITVCSKPKNQYYPVTTLDSMDNFMIIWLDQRNGTGEFYGRVLDNAGAPAGSEFRIRTGPGRNSYAFSSIARFSNDDVIIVYSTDRNGSSSGQDIYACRFDRNGTMTGGEIAVCTSAETQNNPSVAIDSNDNFLVVWWQMINWNSDIYGQRFDAAGKKLGSVITLLNDPKREFLVQMGIDSQDRYIVQYSSMGNVGDGDVFLWMFDKDGNKLGSEVPICTGDNDQTMSFFAVNPEDDLVFGWQELRSKYEVYARKFIHPYELAGSLKTGTLAPQNLWKWLSVDGNRTYMNSLWNAITFEYSKDDGASWIFVPSNGSLAKIGAPPSIRLKAIFRTIVNSTTPRLAGLKVDFITNDPPSISLPPDITAWRNDNVSIQAVLNDTDGDQPVLEWSQLGGPFVKIDDTSPPGMSFVPNSSGIYRFRVVASDGYNESRPALINVTVGNRPPVIQPIPDLFSWKDGPVVLECCATDPDGDALSSVWTQTDGDHIYFGPQPGPAVSFRANFTGRYIFEVFASDGEAESERVPVNLTVLGRPPTAVLEVNTSNTFVGSPVLFNASASSDPDGAISQYLFHFGDGNESGWIPRPYMEHAFVFPGVFKASVEVQDDDGNISMSDNATITVSEPSAHPPVPALRIITPREGITLEMRNITVSFRVENATIAPGASHLHFKLDDQVDTAVYTLDDLVLKNVTDGHHTLLAFLENATNERIPNPEASATVNFSVSVPAPKLPDMQIPASGVGIEPAVPKEGDIVRFSIGMNNSGDGDAGPFTVGVYVDGKSIMRIDIPGLRKGDVARRQAEWKAKPGAHTLRVVLDDGNSIWELNETNNEASMAFNVSRTAAPAKGFIAGFGLPAVIISIITVMAGIDRARRRRT